MMSNNPHYSRARYEALRQADALINAIKAGRMNASSFPLVMGSFLDQVAFNDYRKHLFALCMERLDGRARPEGSGSSRLPELGLSVLDYECAHGVP